MIRKLIPGAFAIGLIATAVAEKEAPQGEAAKPEGAPPAAGAPAAPPVPQMDPAEMKTASSYALGFRTGGGFMQNFGRFGVSAADLDEESFVKGLFTAIKDAKPEMDEKKLQDAMQAFGASLEKREKEKAAANLAAGEKFLAENGKRAGVNTTPSGLQYEVINKGGEEKYKAPEEGKEDNKQFMVNYKGTLIDGKQFDASPEGKPVAMTLQVVPGFKEALTTMPVGAKWKLFIPSKLAYGEERRSAEIAPNSALVFELELVKIQDAPAAPGGGMPFPMPQGGAPGGGQ